jgi:Flp pilus assembly CpaE family ATPase
MKENRTKVIRARLSEEEKEQVFRRAKAEGVTLSMYLRKSVLGERITSKADIQTVFEPTEKIGTNLNQLAKHVNSLPVDENIRLSLESIEMYIKELKQITDKLI